MEDKVISRLRKNASEEIRIAFREYHGRKLVDIRIFAGPRGQETVPTPKGVSVPIEIFGEFKNAIDDAEEFLEQR